MPNSIVPGTFNSPRAEFRAKGDTGCDDRPCTLAETKACKEIGEITKLNVCRWNASTIPPMLHTLALELRYSVMSIKNNSSSK